MPGYTDFRMTVKEGTVTECLILTCKDDKPERWFPGELLTGNPNGRAHTEVQARVSPFVHKKDLEGIADESRMMLPEVTYYVFPFNQSMRWLMQGIDLLRQEMEQLRNDPTLKAVEKAREVFGRIGDVFGDRIRHDQPRI